MNVGDTVQTLGDFWVKPLDGSMRRLEYRVGEIGKVVAIDDVAIEISIGDRVVWIPAKIHEKCVKVISDGTQE